MCAERAASEELAELRERVADLERQNEHLRVGLASRIIIEQAKGVLIERLALPPEDIFEVCSTALPDEHPHDRQRDPAEPRDAGVHHAADSAADPRG